MIDLHVQTLEGIVGRRPDQSVVELWNAASQVGYSTATVPERLGGGGGSLEDGAEIARAAARVLYGAPVGVSNVVLGPLLAASDWPARDDVPAVVMPDEPRGGPSIVDFGACAQIAYLVRRHRSGSRLTMLDLASDRLGRRAAGRADPGHVAWIELSRAVALDEVALEVPYEHWFALGALSSAISIEGAVDTLVKQTVEYLDTRVQFGRRLIQFQALQHRLAELAARAALLSNVVDEAVYRASWSDADALLAAAAAKIEAAGIGSSVVSEAHQLHGAIGYTEESGLGEFSKLIWSQTRRYGSGQRWQAWLGSRTRAGDLWVGSAPLGTAVAAARGS